MSEPQAVETVEQMLEVLDNFKNPLAHHWLRPEDAAAIAAKLREADELRDFIFSTQAWGSVGYALAFKFKYGTEENL